MANKNAIGYLLNPKNWRLPLLIIFTVSIACVTLIGIHTILRLRPYPTMFLKMGFIARGRKGLKKYHPETITQPSNDEKTTTPLAQY